MPYKEKDNAGKPNKGKGGRLSQEGKKKFFFNNMNSIQYGVRNYTMEKQLNRKKYYSIEAILPDVCDDANSKKSKRSGRNCTTNAKCCRRDIFRTEYKQKIKYRAMETNIQK